MVTMNTATALLLAFNLINAGRPARVVDVGHGQAIVVMEGRPGCTASGLNGDPNRPVVTCDKVVGAKR